MGKALMAQGLVIPIAKAENALEIVGSSLSTIEVPNANEVVGSNGSKSTGSGSIVVGDGNVALLVHHLELWSNVPSVSSNDGTGSEPDELVVQDDESLRVVKVAVGKSRVVVHDVSVGRSGTVALLVQNEHETEVDSVGLSVVNIELIHSLDGSDGDGSSNATRRTIANRDLIETLKSPRSIVVNAREVETDIKELALNT